MILPSLPDVLIRFGAVLRESSADEMGDGGALPYAVWSEGEDGDILGAGMTPEEAIAEAVETVEGWKFQ